MSTVRITSLALCLTWAAGLSVSAAEEIDGFTEPWRRLQVAAAEQGLIETLEVEEGQAVSAGQAVAHLDRDPQRANLEVARRTMEARGQQAQARAELQAANLRLEKLKQLLGTQHASSEEVEKAERDRDIAAAHLQVAQEASAVSAAEFERAKVQLERRTVRSPVEGVVTEIRRNLGEYVPQNEPTVMTIVQLDPLRATFSVPTDRVAGFQAGRDVSVRLPSSASPVAGTVEFVSPLTTAPSGTVLVKVRLPNPHHRHRAGEKCELLLGYPAGPIPRPTASKPR